MTNLVKKIIIHSVATSILSTGLTLAYWSSDRAVAYTISANAFLYLNLSRPTVRASLVVTKLPQYCLLYQLRKWGRVAYQQPVLQHHLQHLPPPSQRPILVLLDQELTQATRRLGSSLRAIKLYATWLARRVPRSITCSRTINLFVWARCICAIRLCVPRKGEQQK